MHNSQDVDRRHTTRSLAEAAKATFWARFALSLGRRCGGRKEMRLAAFRPKFQGLTAIKKKVVPGASRLVAATVYGRLSQDVRTAYQISWLRKRHFYTSVASL